MILEAIHHIPKSHMAYALNENTLTITLQTAKADAHKVKLIIGDPFEWYIEKDVYHWGGKIFPHREMKKTYETELFDYYTIDATTPNKRSKYAFLIESGDETYFYGCRNLIKIDMMKDEAILFDLLGYFNFPYINKEDLIDSPDWSKNTIWYQIFLDRFHKSENKQGNYLPFNSVKEGITNHMFFGGDLLGVVEKIPYLKDLGITGIYFTPIFKAYSAHKYDTEDYFLIDPSFGTNEDFKKLVDTCHQAGIKVMLDAVFNHCGFKHPYFQDVIKNKRNSPYWDCFFIENENFIDFELDENGRPLKHTIKPKFRTFAFTPHMPKLNTSNPIMEKYLLDVAAFWVEKYDIDGWRLDVSNEVSHVFWRKFRERVRHIKKDVYILGENWDDSTPWLRGDQFDAVMNYEIAYPVWQFFGKTKISQKLDANAFRYKINKLLLQYPKTVSINMFNLVDSHDTMRIMSRVQNNPDLVKLAYLFIFSFPGAPAIFYGDEIGMEGKEDPDCRRCMIWNEEEQNQDLLVFFKTLIQFRKTYQDFSNVEFFWHKASGGVLIYQKENLTILMNNNDFETIETLPEVINNQEVLDLFDNQHVLLSSQIKLDPYSFKCFFLKK